MNILCIFYTQNRQTFQTKNHQECKSSVNFTLLISIRFSFPHKFSLCIFIKFLSSDLLKIIFYFFVSTSTFVPAIVRYQIFSFPVLPLVVKVHQVVYLITFRNYDDGSISYALFLHFSCFSPYKFYFSCIFVGSKTDKSIDFYIFVCYNKSTS